MTAWVKYRDLFSAGLSLGFVVFVIASVLVKTLVPTASADVELHPAATTVPETSTAP
jgi:hypothetical protein